MSESIDPGFRNLVRGLRRADQAHQNAARLQQDRQQAMRQANRERAERLLRSCDQVARLAVQERLMPQKTIYPQVTPTSGSKRLRSTKPFTPIGQPMGGWELATFSWDWEHGRSAGTTTWYFGLLRDGGLVEYHQIGGFDKLQERYESPDRLAERLSGMSGDVMKTTFHSHGSSYEDTAAPSLSYIETGLARFAMQHGLVD